MEDSGRRGPSPGARTEEDVRAPRRRAGWRVAAIAVVTAAAALLLAATAATPAQIRLASRGYLPTETRPRAFYFRPTVRANERIVDAWLRVWRPASLGGPYERNVNVRDVEQAALRGAQLRIDKHPSSSMGRLMVTIRQTGNFPDPPECAVDPLTMTAPGCTVLRRDTGTASDPRPGLWGTIDCQSSARYQYMTSGGDPSPMPTGVPQGDDDYRRLTVFDGDNFWGERCELGRNWHANGENSGGRRSGTFALYRSGDRRITFFSQRYPDNFSRSTAGWQAIAQLKQAQPADNGGGGPVLELQLHDNRLWIVNDWKAVWSTRAPAPNTWIRYALDVTYSPDPALGSLRLYVDLNGDGDALDAGEASRRFELPTQLIETDGPNGGADGLLPGDPIPDHLRLGIYHDPSIGCPAPTGCAVEVDNVQVVRP